MEVQLLLVHISLMTLWSLSYSATLGASSSPSLAKPGCQSSCGAIEIPYPFGIGDNCFSNTTEILDESFQILCDNSTMPPKPFLNLTDSQPEVLEISLDERTLKIRSPITFSDCPDKKSNRQPPNLIKTSFWFSSKNIFTSVSCGRIASLKSYGRTEAVCLSICGNESVVNNSCGGVNCCQTNIFYRLDYFNASFGPRIINETDSSIEGPCKYAFLVDPDLLEWTVCKGHKV